MKQYLHNSDELFETPQYGWEQMQFLLEKNLPQKETNRRAAPLLTIFIAASLLILFLLSSLVIKNIDHPFNFGNVAVNSLLVQHTNIPAVAADPQRMRNSAVVQTSYPTLDRTPENTNVAKLVFGEDNSNSSLLPSFPVTAMPYGENSRVWDDHSTSIVNSKTKAEKLTTENISNNDSSNRATKKEQQRKKGSWNLFAGLGVNATIGEKQNLQPYPMATVRYNVNKKLFVSLGVAAGSPVSVSSKGVNKTVYLNDTANNVNFYNNVKHYSRLHYVDIPLTAGIKIGKRFAVQAGVQASVLLDSKTTTAIDKYDFRMNMSTDFPGTLLTSIPAVSEENYTVKARKIDYRITGGIQYTVNKASFHLNYQYAPKAALSGEHVSSAKNELISLGVQFKLK